MEDGLGDMDFKVAGTADGVTALQMDIKVKGITYEIMAKALEQAREGRMYIMEKMLDTLDAPREELSVYAPRIQTIKINPDKIGAVIGPGGKMIRRIQEESGAKIDIEADGSVSVLADFGEVVERAPEEVGVVRASELADYLVMRPEDVVSVGDEITVMVVEVDSQGRINLSRRAALSGEIPSAAEMDGERRGAGRGMGRPGGGNYGGGRRDNPNPNRGSGGYNDRGGYGGERDRGGYSGGRSGGGYGDRGGSSGGVWGSPPPQGARGPQPRPRRPPPR